MQFYSYQETYKYHQITVMTGYDHVYIKGSTSLTNYMDIEYVIPGTRNYLRLLFELYLFYHRLVLST